VLFFRKRMHGETPAEDWIKSENIAIGDNKSRVNQYFHDHPEDVLGEHSMQGSMYRGEEYTVTGSPENIEGRIRDRASEIAERSKSSTRTRTT